MGKRPDTWMPLYVGDYLRDTMHLTTEQHGAYLLLIMACWVGGGVLPGQDAQLAVIARISPEKWRKMRPVIAAFFQADAGGWSHNRISKELAKTDEVIEKRRNAGLASATAALARREGLVNRSRELQERLTENLQTVNTCSTHVEHMLQHMTQQTVNTMATQHPTNGQHNVGPSPSHTDIEDSDASASAGWEPASIASDPVKGLWDRGVSILGEKRRSLFGKYLKAYGPVVVLASIVETESEQPFDPAAYFIGCCERRKANGGRLDAEAQHSRSVDDLGDWARRTDERESVRGNH
jgi:uncharacterized protein YdaU (DUF1376 family)